MTLRVVTVFEYFEENSDLSEDIVFALTDLLTFKKCVLIYVLIQMIIQNKHSIQFKTI